tara:strand:- start:4390 stop:4599 length:210 start_codon:yes stop_codon:yes gene_type:complete
MLEKKYRKETRNSRISEFNNTRSATSPDLTDDSLFCCCCVVAASFVPHSGIIIVQKMQKEKKALYMYLH